MTSPRRWREIQHVLDGALDLAPESRAAYVTAACGADAELRDRVVRLLNGCVQAERTESVLASPAAGFAAPILADLRLLDEKRRTTLADTLGTALAGRYTIERTLGQGGMAVVFLARDLRHDRAVAVKVLARDLVAPSSVERFLQEIRVTARLSHPHVLPVHDSGEVDGLLYFVTPYVEGETLRAKLTHEGAVSLPETARLLRELADALAFAHARGVVHRDLKPENILLSGGHAVVADFGIAQALADAAETGAPSVETSSRGIVLGTPAYMAPEQAVGNASTDHRADLYAFGVIAYELLAGSHPFGKRSPQGLLLAHLNEAATPLDELCRELPPTLVALVMGCLAKTPAGRPASADAVLAALDDAAREFDAAASRHSRDPIGQTVSSAADRPGGAQRVPPPPAVAAHRRRRTVQWAALALPLLVSIALGSWWSTRTDLAAAAAPIRLVVLPFDESAENDESDYLAAGLGDAISTELSRLRAVITPTYGATRHYRNTTDSLSRIARETSADAIVSGSVRRIDDRIVVEAQLFNVRVARRLWTQRFERPIAEVLDIRSAVTQAIVTALQLDLNEAERTQLIRPPTTNARAYDLYLRGRAIELRAYGTEMPEDDIREAQSLYSRASDVDPNFAMARSRLALMHIQSGTTYDPAPARFEQARLEAETALRLQPGLAEAHEALAAYWNVGRKDDARSLEQIQLNLAGSPNSVDLHVSLAASYRNHGRWDEAVAALERARQLEPRSLAVASSLAFTFTLLRQYEKSAAAWDTAVALSPDNPIFRMRRAIVFLMWRGTADSIATVLRTVPADWDPGALRTLAGYLVARTRGRNEEAIAVLDSSRHELLVSSRAYRPLSLMRAQTYEALGDRARARSNYEAARAMITDSLAVHPDVLTSAASSPVANMRTALGLAYAGLGRKQEAIREARRAMELVPLSTNTQAATAAMAGAAEVFVQAGETDAALELLELLLGMAAGHDVSVSLLRGNPAYHPLRGHPRFEKLLDRFSMN